MTALILSGSYLESNRYLQSEGIRGRHATSAASVAGEYFTSIIQLPSFDRRFDKHAVLSAVKRKTRGRPVDWKVLDEWTPPEKAPTPETFTRSDWLFGSVEPAKDVHLTDADREHLDGPPAPPAAVSKRAQKRPAKKRTSSLDEIFGDD